MNLNGLFLIVLLLFILTLSCGEQSPPASPIPPRGVPVERVGDLAIYQLFCDRFEGLPLETKRYLYHLCRACLAGRDVAYDQLAPRGLEVRRLLERLVMTADGSNPDFDQKLLDYAKGFWAFSGNYDPETWRKFTPAFTPAELAARIAGLRSEGDGWPSDEGLKAIEPYIFDADFLPVLVNKAPPDGGDPVQASAVNFYDLGLTVADIEAYPSQFTLNNRFAQAGGQVVEEVYRVGAPDVTPGRMAACLEEVVTELETAITFAPDGSRPALVELVGYLRTGAPSAFVRHQELWVKDTSSPVDYIIGFIEVYHDPLARHGTFEGMVLIEDSDQTGLMRSLAEDASWFEARMPWDDAYKKRNFTLPTARTFEVLCGTGDAGPRCPVGINLPNLQRLRGTIGTKNFLLTNVMETGAEERARLLFGEFLPTRWERERALALYDERRRAMVALHEVTGHGSGKVSPKLRGDPGEHLREFASAIEEARADLVALWFIGDAHLVELGLVPPELTREGAYTAYLAWSLIALRDVPVGDQFEEDHTRAGQMITRFIIDRGGAELEELDGKHYLRLVDVEVAHAAVGELLAELQRIRATGDRKAARRLVETYGLSFDPALRDEVVARVGPLNLPKRRAFIMPELELVTNRMGGVRDVRILYPGDFKGQMLRFAALK